MSDKQTYNNEMRFVLFPKKQTDNQKSPSWDGTLTINGKEWKITGWNRESRFGKHFISGEIEEPKPVAEPSASKEAPAADEPW